MDQTENESTGTVKFYNSKAKFGFIVCSVTTREYYVKSSGLIDPIKDGDKVAFSIETHPKGPKAINVKIRNE